MQRSCGLVKPGVVSALGVGFDIIDAQPIDAKKPRDGLRISWAQLLEISFPGIVRPLRLDQIDFLALANEFVRTQFF
jgi:hypothetical protein